MSPRPPIVCALLTALALGSLLAAPLGCTYEREYGYKPFFTGLEGAEISTPASADVLKANQTPQRLAEPRFTNDDGSITLVNATGRHLMANIVYCLEQDDPALFVDQILSQQTITDAYAKGHEPEDVFDILKENADDVRELFTRMPFGEHSPTVIMKPLGPNKFEIRLTGVSARNLKWRSMTMVMEHGNWRLVWFGT
jgi:hypothetical protein